jgi:hypothetical protein
MPFIKAHLLKVANPTLKSFSIRHDYLPYFYNQYHYHPEVELLFIQEGTGTQFVGDSITYAVIINILVEIPIYMFPLW